jgi:hypothetical protein
MCNFFYISTASSEIENLGIVLKSKLKQMTGKGANVPTRSTF